MIACLFNHWGFKMIQTDSLHIYLQEAINILNSLIKFTQEDIDDIKVANHEVIFNRCNTKAVAIKEFEYAKSRIDKEIIDLTKKHPHLNIAQILDEKADLLLADMRKALEELKSINRHYAHIAFALSEFYTSIADRLIPREKADYKSRAEQSQLLKIEV
ncbi:Uncharacterised protein [Helicobacter muridarum]|uniref:Flagellar protein FlgN n=2 Tax=Helicobacter muridarum TaxID=216 RepID=A0A377PXE6_9HELI|nr:Uncharacterised protein [Helicobacter muridarum]